MTIQSNEGIMNGINAVEANYELTQRVIQSYITNKIGNDFQCMGNLENPFLNGCRIFRVGRKHHHFIILINIKTISNNQVWCKVKIFNIITILGIFIDWLFSYIILPGIGMLFFLYLLFFA